MSNLCISFKLTLQHSFQEVGNLHLFLTTRGNMYPTNWPNEAVSVAAQ
jgi:hypothetical protein